MKSRYHVFLPVRNSEKSIEKATGSLVGQSCPPEKILVVNDGSTDGTNGVLLSENHRCFDVSCFIRKADVDTSRTTLRLHRGRACHLYCWRKYTASHLLEEYA